jgi:hypothetical protein
MKLLIITCIREHEKHAMNILHQSGVKVFSITETTGIKDGQSSELMDNWFSRGEGRVESLFIYSFTAEENATKAMNAIKEFNLLNNEGFPLRSFVMPVEQASY